MGDPSVEVTEEMQDAAQFAKLRAMDAVSEGLVVTFEFVIPKFCYHLLACSFIICFDTFEVCCFQVSWMRP